MQFFKLFTLDMKAVLDTEIQAHFSHLVPVPLAPDSLEELRTSEDSGAGIQKGLYHLYHRDELVYVGKADDSLHSRLLQHFRKISARNNIETENMSFRCLYLDSNWCALSQESSLIEDAQKEGLATWNNSGFGLHDPGRKRDRTGIKEGHFDRMYPINPDHELGAQDGD